MAFASRDVLRQHLIVNAMTITPLLVKSHAMPKTLIQNVVQQLDRERIRLQTELSKVTAALTAFGRVYLEGSKPGKGHRKRDTISAAGRKRIAAAQRARWAKVKAKQKKS